MGYLREIGALEETDNGEQRVMIANYMASPSNCISPSGFYSVCCKNECESLLGHLEQKIAGPEAKTTTISDLVAKLASSTVPAPRILSDTLLRRLDEIASHHGGVVPLHGRLFAQWMHHAYPRECAYPHVSGTTTTKLPEEWLHDSSRASEEEMLRISRSSTAATANNVNDEDLMAWSSQEELLVVQPLGVLQSMGKSASAAKRSVLLFIIAVSFAYGLVQTMKTMGSRKYKCDKFIV